MQPTVVRVESTRMDELRQWLSTRHATEVRKSSVYEIFRFTYAGETIVGYTSGKVVIYGEQASSLIREAILDLFFDENKYDLTIGSDEAGKGEWLGPLTVAAVAITPKQAALLQGYGVMDSKELPLHRIPMLAGVIESNSSAFKTLIIAPEKFNQRYQEFHAERKGLNDILAWTHAKIISEIYHELNLMESDARVRVVIDQFAREKTEARLRRVMDFESITLIQKHKAEEEIAVAAASIVARQAREEWINRACERHGLDLRALDANEAAKHIDRHLFTKTSYLP